MNRAQRVVYLVTVAAMVGAVATLLVPLAMPGRPSPWLEPVQVTLTVVIVVGALGYVTVSGRR